MGQTVYNTVGYHVHIRVSTESTVEQRKFNDASFIMVSENCLSQANKDIPQIWFNTFEECDERP